MSWQDVRKYLYPQMTAKKKKPSPDPDDARLTEEGVPAEWTWLYETEDWSDSDWIRFKALYATDTGRKWIEYAYAVRRDREYRERYNINRSDIHDPTKLYTIRALGGLNWNPLPESLQRLYR